MAPSREHIITEQAFAALVEDLEARVARGGMDADHARARLRALLCEADAVYSERSAAAVVRMRGWVLLAFGRIGLREDELIYALEELDNGTDPYLIAAAAQALRTYPVPKASFVSFVDGAIERIRYHDDSLNLSQYGGYGGPEVGTTASAELAQTRRWLKKVKELRPSANDAGATHRNSCCAHSASDATSASASPRGSTGSHELAVFEDQAGTPVRFAEFFHGKPSVVAFFYTRCDNPLKCSLTVSKLAHLQRLLRERGFDGKIRTAAITYDPAFDLPARLAVYARNRAISLDAEHRMLRATRHWDAVRAYFDLSVNFVGSIVNRHGIELFVLDAQGRIVASFERLRWSEEEVLARATKLLPASPDDRKPPDPPAAASVDANRSASVASVTLGTVATVATAFFPKCAMCWSAYLSVLGLAGLESIPYSPWLLPLFVGLMLVNLAALWRSGIAAFTLAASGVFTILVLGIGLEISYSGPVGLALSLAGSLLSVRSRIARQLRCRLVRTGPAAATAQ